MIFFPNWYHSMTLMKDSLYKRYLQGGKRFADLEVLNHLTISINDMITNSKRLHCKQQNPIVWY